LWDNPRSFNGQRRNSPGILQRLLGLLMAAVVRRQSARDFAALKTILEAVP